MIKLICYIVLLIIPGVSGMGCYVKIIKNRTKMYFLMVKKASL